MAASHLTALVETAHVHKQLCKLRDRVLALHQGSTSRELDNILLSITAVGETMELIDNRIAQAVAGMANRAERHKEAA